MPVITGTATANTAEALAGTNTPDPSSVGSAETVPEGVVDVATAVAARTPEPTPTPNRVDQEIAQITADLGISGKTLLGITTEDWFDLGISALIVLVGYFLGIKLLTAILRWVANRTNTELDNALIKHLAPDLKWLVFLFFTRYAFLRLDFLRDSFRKMSDDLFFLLGLVIITTIGIRLVRYWAAWYKDNLKKDEDRVRLAPVIMSVERILILVILVLMLSVGLSHFGINLGALTITILILALILSLGAKDTITDAISGFVILIDQPFRVHDGIQIKELDTWGDVIEIGTRTTRVLTRDNREVIIPNTRMLNSQVVNYTYPDTKYRMQVDLRIAYASDLEKARQVILNTVRQVDGILPDKEVEVIFVEFGDTARNMRVRWWVADYHQDYEVLNKVCTVIDAALNKAGIEIPITAYDLKVRMQSGEESEDDRP